MYTGKSPGALPGIDSSPPQIEDEIEASLWERDTHIGAGT